MNAPEFKETEESIYDLLEVVRKKPGLYICEPSLQRLYDFLGGYTAGLGRARIILRNTDEFHKFHNWVAHRLGFQESTSGWYNMIRNKSANEEEAFKQFFILLDEFRKELARS